MLLLTTQQPALCATPPADALRVYFDGSLRGRAGGAGAIVVQHGTVVWQGARFLTRPASSAATEYEGLLLGLEGAASLRGRVDASAAVALGDCKIVIAQLSGDAKSRKLGKLHARAEAAAAALPWPLAVSHVPRDENAHADYLARAAVDGMEAVWSGALLARCRSGARATAVPSLLGEGWARAAPTPAAVFDELAEMCRDAGDASSVMAVLAEARTRGTPSPRTAAAALWALEARGIEAGRVHAELKRLAAADVRGGPPLGWPLAAPDGVPAQPWLDALARTVGAPPPVVDAMGALAAADALAQGVSVCSFDANS